MKFVHLHVHTHYSLLDGLPQIKPLINRVKDLGMDSVAITDHGVMYGVVEFYKTCLDNGVKPVLGVEAYVALDKLNQRRPNIDNRNFHLVLLAENFEGYKNLMRLVSVAHVNGFYYKPRIDLDLLKDNSSGIIGLSACLKGQVSRAILYKKEKDVLEIIKKYQSILGEDSFFLEMQPHTKLKEQMAVNDFLKKISRQVGVPLVATNDVHYLNEEDAYAQDVLTCISTGKSVNDTKRMKMSEVNCYMNSPEQILEYFKDTPEALENTVKISERCQVEIPLGKFHFPKIELPAGSTADEVLRQNAFSGLAWRYKMKNYESVSIKEIVEYMNKNYPGVVDRMEYELGIIKTKRYSAYFLIVSDFTLAANKKGIITTTRGSAAGSLVSYCIGILHINPLNYNLPFERFLNPYRASAPDIDIDIEESRRHEVIEYVSQKYGKDKVAQIITFGSMLARGAVRDVARTLDVPYSVADAMAKMIPMGSQGFTMTLEHAKEESRELKNMYDSDPQVKRVFDLAEQIEGCARHASVHAAGVVISPSDMNDFCPVQRDSDNKGVVTQYEMHAVEDVGLVKMDFLGLRNLSMIGKALEIIKITQNINIDIYDIPLNDAKTFDMLSAGHTYGVFQLSGSGMTKYLVEMKPTRIHDIMALVALYRPGPMNSIPEYIKRKRNPSLVTYLDPRMKEILDISYGIITYQDDVLLIAINLAGYTWGEADKLRKAMGKKIVDEMAKQKNKFIQGAVSKGMEEDKANELFKLIEPFAAYGFNKAHACSYGTVAYQTSYLKANYTAEYMAAFMTCESGDNDKIAEAIRECNSLGIEVLPPDINESLKDFTVVNDKTIRFGLLAIKNIGEGIINAVISEREKNGVFVSLDDFVSRIRDRSFNKKILENFAKSGCLDRFCERTQIIGNMENILNYARTQHKAYAAGQESLFGANPKDKFVLGLKLTDVLPVGDKEKLGWEKELLGVYLSDHPFGAVEKKLKGLLVSIKEITKLSEGSEVFVGGILTGTKQIVTKKGDSMMFASLADTSDMVELIFFPSTYKKVKAYLEEDHMMLVDGKISCKDGVAKVIVETVHDLDTEGAIEKIKVTLKPKSISKSLNFENSQINTVESFNLRQSLIVVIHYPLSAELTDNLKKLFFRYKGDVKVFLRVFTQTQFKIIETEYSVDLNKEFLKELRCYSEIRGIQIK